MFSVYQSILQIKYIIDAIDAIDEIRGGKYMDAVIEILKGPVSYTHLTLPTTPYV